MSSTAATDQLTSARTRALALAALSLSVLVVGLDTTVLNVALPSISTALDADTASLQWVVDTYLLAVVAVMLPAGVLGDRWGHRSVLMGGLVVFGAASVLSTLASSAPQLIAARALQGVGAAVLVPLSLALITTTFPSPQRSRAIGVLTAAVAAGLPLGPVLGGALLARWSWQSVFWVNVPVVAVALAAVWLLVPAGEGERSARVDWVGALTSTTAMVALVYAVIHAPTSGWTSAVTLTTTGAAVLLLVLFVLGQHRRALRGRHRLVDLSLFGDARFSGGSLAVAAASAVLLALLFVVPQHLQGVRGASAAATGLGVLPLMVGLVMAGAASTRLQQRWGTRAVVTSAFVVLAAGTAGIAVVSATTPYVLLAVGLVIAGAGIGAAVAPAMDAATGAVPTSAAAAGSALVNTVRQLSGALAVAALGSVLSQVYRSQLSPALSALPATERARALGSITGASADAALRHSAGSAFSVAMSVVMLICTVLALLSAAVTCRVLPSNEASR